MTNAIYEVNYKDSRFERCVVVLAQTSDEAVQKVKASDPEFDNEAFTTTRRCEPELVFFLSKKPL